jgi:putative tryptophan/tyrosine transport system substrate-binding protein
MKRRDFLTLAGGAAAAWPLAARAQQPAMRVVGFLSSYSANAFGQRLLDVFRQGLSETGYIEGRNVAIESRWADGQYDRLPELAADLARHQVAVIAATAGSATAAVVTKAATIPIVFQTAGDPVAQGLVASLNRPGGNLTGVTSLNGEVAPKRMELLRELVPAASIAVLVRPENPNFENQLRDLHQAARALGLQLHEVTANTESDFEAAFATLSRVRAGALMISIDALLISRSEQLATLTLRHAVPAIYSFREFAAAGGLVSYGGSLPESYRLVGAQVGRILRGEKPATLPVQQATKVELVINLKTAKAFGLTVPLPLLARADEVIE